MTGRSVTRASLGREAQLGDLYDIRTEKFLNESLFISKLEEDMVETMDIAETEIEITSSDSLEEKCKILDVEDELQLSVAVGMLELSGSGAFLGDERRSARTESKSLIYKLSTVNEEVMLRQNKDIIDKEVLSGTNPDATHVVVGIDWGAQCTISCEYENDENDVSDVTEKMDSGLEKIKDILNAKEGVNVLDDDRDTNDTDTDDRKELYKYRADVLTSVNFIPTMYEGAAELARSLPTLLKNTESRKGVPIKYYLTSLETVRKKIRVKATKDITCNDVDECIVQKCAQFLEKVKGKTQKVYDIYHEMTLNGTFISDEALERIDIVWEEVTQKESRFKTDLQEMIIRVRSGEDAQSVLEEFLSKVDSEEVSASKYEKEFEPYLQKVRFIGSMLSQGVRCIGKNDELVTDAKENTFVFYIPSNSDFDSVEKNREFLLRLLSTFSMDEMNEFIVVDQEVVLSHVWSDKVKRPTIAKYVDGILKSEDLYEEQGQHLEMCMIQLAGPITKNSAPRQRAMVKLRCPNAIAGNGRCAGDPSKWRCLKCGQPVEYGPTSKMFYCKCGESNPKDSRFRCNDPHHGLKFMMYPKNLLRDDLSQLKPMKEVNILILGETGVGKSTWINGIQNYLSFANLSEAMNSQDFPVLIPSSFTLTQNGVQKKIKIGTDDPNEVQETGKSATKEPRSYVFTVGDIRLRLIDTPGIGDSGGVEKDEINMKNILSHLMYYSEIHAICILLKPNNARLTVMFRFCIQELLVQFHNSAKRNIVFCFTNARQTFYQPGDTLPALNEELAKKNVGIQATKDTYFCFDNEPFRFLACIKNGVTFGDGEIATYSSSWDKSVEETRRLLKYIECHLKPHRVKETLGMNEARRIIIAMSKPLAEVGNAINHNLDAAKEIKAKIGHADTEMISLRKELKFKGYDLERKELGYPRTVCAAPECVKYVPVGQTKVQNTVYETICHPHCYLEGVPIETTGNPQLAKCWAMTNQYCRICTHSYQQHMHLTYEIQLKEKEFLSTQAQQQLNAIHDTKTKKEAFINEINKKVEELKAEQKIIMATGAKFGSFLKANALITYNDAVEEYLEMCIKQEKAKPVTLRKESVLENMTKMKEEYKKQIEILDNAIAGGANENIKTPEQVKEFQEDLFKLKHFGGTLRKLFEEISLLHTARGVPYEVVHAQAPKRTYRKKNRYSRWDAVTNYVGHLVPWRKTVYNV
ncbi:uncharacterized protein LOC121421583 [Lytechinus variegatus]|uniref:uncharacterized protein LOC121421583 n=1 Tax=Lytechinus variegatus TaxID=7654 RepID=UPI001BB18368|nr:uncharacterized protein LOC121421583 [Lytechinus variegatus]